MRSVFLMQPFKGMPQHGHNPVNEIKGTDKRFSHIQIFLKSNIFSLLICFLFVCTVLKDQVRNDLYKGLQTSMLNQQSAIQRIYKRKVVPNDQNWDKTISRNDKITK